MRTGLMLLAWMFTGLHVARAAAPDQVRAWVEPGTSTGALRQLVVSPDGQLVAGVGSSGVVALLNVSGWTAQTWKPCTSATSVTLRANGSLTDIFVGCADGALYAKSWMNGALVGWGDKAVGDQPIASPYPGKALHFLTMAADGRLYALIEAPETTAGPEVNRGDDLIRFNLVGTQATLDNGYGLTGFMQPGFKDAVVNELSAGLGSASTTTQIVVGHGGSYFSSITAETGALSTSLLTGGISVSISDLSARQGGGAYVADGQNKRVAQYVQNTQLPITVLISDMNGPTAVLEMFNASGQVSGLYVADGNDLKVYSMAGDGVSSAVSLQSSFAVGSSIVDLIEPVPDYLVGGTSDGRFAVMTAHPWVSEVTLTPEQTTSGADVEVSFTVDTAGAWSVHLDGDTRGSGLELASGTRSTPGEVQTTFTVPDPTLVHDGTHQIVVVLDDGAGHLGHGAASLHVDNIPEAVGLGPANVGYAENTLIVQFPELQADDIERYHIYISESAFKAEDFSGGGGPEGGLGVPEGKAREVVSPVEVDATSAVDGLITRKLSPLRNQTRYYVAVRAYDATHEGPMSAVVAQIPRSTMTASALAGEQGGPPEGCNTLGGRSAGLAAMLGVLALWRRKHARALLLGLPLALAVPSARAADDPFADEAASQAPRPKRDIIGALGRDETPAWSTFELGYGSFTFDDPNIASVYGAHAGALRFSAGVQIFRVVELRAGIGELGKKGTAVDASGSSSNQEIRMQWLPLQLELAARIHILDEQPVVPYARVGLDWVFWRETPLDADGGPVKAARIVGSKKGWHWAAGGQILLDTFMPRRASMLEANTGINDTWIYVEYSKQYINRGGTGLDLSGWAISAGLKLDY